MKSFHKLCSFTLPVLAACAVLSAGSLAEAGFTSYVIRNGAGDVAPQILPNNAYVPDATEFVIFAGSQKAAWGSNDINGHTMGQITNLSITRHDDTERDGLSAGAQVAPYFNIWVTDGNGNYAVLANEPSNPGFQPLFVDNGNGSKSYNLSFADLASHPVQVYETPNGGYGSTTTWVHNLLNKNIPLTFADVAGLTIAAPPESYITDGANAVGGGAPRELGTNVAYGVNWVFGDTLANYVSGDDGYIVSNPLAVAVPEPGSVALTAMAAVGFAGFIRRRKRVLRTKAAS